MNSSAIFTIDRDLVIKYGLQKAYIISVMSNLIAYDSVNQPMPVNEVDLKNNTAFSCFDKADFELHLTDLINLKVIFYDDIFNGYMITDYYTHWLNSQKGKYTQSSNYTPILSRCHLYVFRKGNFYKIGKSKNINNRLKQLNIASFEPIELCFIGNGLGSYELQLHKMYSHKRLNTEWFSLTDDDLTEIKAFIDNKQKEVLYGKN